MSNTQEEFMQKLAALLGEYEVSIEAKATELSYGSGQPVIEIWGPDIDLTLHYIDEQSA